MASRTTTLCGFFNRDAVSFRVSTVLSSNVNVIFTILRPYYHTRILLTGPVSCLYHVQSCVAVRRKTMRKAVLGVAAVSVLTFSGFVFGQANETGQRGQRTFTTNGNGGIVDAPGQRGQRGQA